MNHTLLYILRTRITEIQFITLGLLELAYLELGQNPDTSGIDGTIDIVADRSSIRYLVSSSLRYFHTYLRGLSRNNNTHTDEHQASIFAKMPF